MSIVPHETCRERQAAPSVHRGVLSGTDGRTYPWGNEEPGARACWNRWSAKEGTCAVGSYASGAFGLKDMAGNVWEWTASGYTEDYSRNRVSGARVQRGGGWSMADAPFLRSSHRRRGSSGIHDTGFRCAR